MPPEISVIVPVFNEGGSIAALVEELDLVLKGCAPGYELIIVDDGSTDQSWGIIKDCAGRFGSVKGVRLGRNFGQTSALSAGISKAAGGVVVTIDGDGQNDPADIPRLLAKLDQGYDMVSGWRRVRKDPFFRRQLPSRMANWLIGEITGVKVKDFGCTLKAYRLELVRKIRLYGEMHRMVPALAYWAGARIAEIEVNHRPRLSGDSKYGLGRFFSVFFDLITIKFFTGYFSRPLHFFGLLGLAVFLLSSLAFAATILMKIFMGTDMTGNALLLLGVLLMIISSQSFALGLLGEISIRIYYESQDKPTYAIKEELGFK